VVIDKMGQRIMSNKELIRSLPNKDLVNTINKIKKEKAHPETYGKHGTSRWVTTSEFWTGYHGELRKELERRKSKGLVSKHAGKSRQQKSSFSALINRLPK
jgi:hypothetical protein